MLAGATGGGVVATNYLRRLWPRGKRTARGDASAVFVQKLCEYEWIRDNAETDANGANMAEKTTENELDTGAEHSIPTSSPEDRTSKSRGRANDNSVFHGQDTRPGRSRFHEGFKAERVDVSRANVRKGKPKTKTEEISYETIFEEEQAVTAADWNPNLRCAGWVAIGWGSGLVRIQDVAHGTAV